MTELQDLIDGAEEWFETAEDAFAAGRLYASYESYRHAAELACKAILLSATGSFPRDHSVAGLLAQKDLLPAEVPARSLHRLLSSYTRGTYGFHQPLHRRDVQQSQRIASRVMEAARYGI